MAQSYVAETKYGKIKVGRNAIARAAVESLEELGNRVTLCSRRGKILRKHSVAELTAVDVEAIEGDIRLTVYVIVRFGLSITKTADAIVDAIRKDVRRMLGRSPSVITVRVRGVISKGVVAPRDITIKRELEVQQ